MTPNLADYVQAGYSLSPEERLEAARLLRLSVDHEAAVDQDAIEAAWRSEISSGSTPSFVERSTLSTPMKPTANWLLNSRPGAGEAVAARTSPGTCRTPGCDSLVRQPRDRPELLDAARQARRDIAAMPEAWPTVLGWEREPHLRRKGISGFPYGIIYFVTSEEIVIVAYAHAKRRPGYWEDRLAD